MTEPITPSVASADEVAKILGCFDRVESMIAGGRSVDDIVMSVVWPEIIIVAEGYPTCFRGLDEVLPFAREALRANGARCEIRG